MAEVRPKTDPQLIEALDALEGAVLSLGGAILSNANALSPASLNEFESCLEKLRRFRTARDNLIDREPEKA